MSHSSVIFRRLSLKDIDPTYALELACFSAPWSRDSYINELTANPAAIYWGGFLQDELVAYGGYWQILDEGTITTFGVAPACRKQGLGQALMDQIISDAKARGVRRLMLEVRVSNAAAIGLYKKLGFVCLETRKAYYPDNREDAFVYHQYLQ